MLINQAGKIYLGNQGAQKVYLGSRLVWELQSESTFTLVGKHSDKPQNTPYITIDKRDFTNLGVDPNTVTAITANGRRYNVFMIYVRSVSDVYIYIENADSLTLNGRETLTIHYRA